MLHGEPGRHRALQGAHIHGRRGCVHHGRERQQARVRGLCVVLAQDRGGGAERESSDPCERGG